MGSFIYFPPKETNLCVSLIASSIPLGIILVRQIHDHLRGKHCFDFKFPFFLVWLPLSTILLTTYLPLAICIDRSLRSAIEDVAWANIAACLVVVRRMRVSAEKIQFSNKKCSYSKSNICLNLLMVHFFWDFIIMDITPGVTTQTCSHTRLVLVAFACSH